jgi:hypothetical protein
MGHTYTLHVTETDLGVTIGVSTDRKSHGTQVTTAQKEGYAMVYVWADVDKKSAEYRCADMQEARNKAWEVARRIGEEKGNFQKGMR